MLTERANDPGQGAVREQDHPWRHSGVGCVAELWAPPNLSSQGAMMAEANLEKKVALVAGATRGGGRGIAVALGEAGATVYCTGRSTEKTGAPRLPRSDSPFALADRPETIEETARLVDSAGGTGIPVCVDHTVETQVEDLVRRIRKEHAHLDILVNCIWGGDELVEWGKPFWELSSERGFTMLERALHTHIMTSRVAVPLLVERRSGLVVEVTDGHTLHYRGNLFHDLVKTSVIRLAFAMGEELREHGVAALAITPGFLRSEAMLDHFGVTELNWREAGTQDPHFLQSETPLYLGRAVAALAADPGILDKTGGVFSSGGLQQEYGYTDRDGTRPNWELHAKANSFGEDQDRSNLRYLGLFTAEQRTL
jgi:NAD(P)-dependent dehydrogenase (short-subunit alcohol dehydrogenase family)